MDCYLDSRLLELVWNLVCKGIATYERRYGCPRREAKQTSCDRLLAVAALSLCRPQVSACALVIGVTFAGPQRFALSIRTCRSCGLEQAFGKSAELRGFIPLLRFFQAWEDGRL